MLPAPGRAASDLYRSYAEALGLEDDGAAPLQLAGNAIAAEELAEMRGGFAMPGGVTVAFGFDIETRLGGVTAERLNMPNTTIGRGMAAPVMTVTDANGVQQQVQRFATVTVDVAGMRNMLSQLGQNRVMENAMSFRRAIPR